MRDLYYFKIPENEIEKFRSCFKIFLNEEQIIRIEKRINDLISDFRVYQGGVGKGRLRERLKKIEDYISFIEKNYEGIEKKEFINLKLQEMEILQSQKKESGGNEDPGPKFLLKFGLFDIYDSFHLEIVREIRKNNNIGERSIQKSMETTFFCNKAAFVSLIQDKYGKQYTGYRDQLEPIDWKVIEQPKNIQDSFFEKSIYKDARAHTLEVFFCNQSKFLESFPRKPEKI